jgi:alkylhydroperoxidase family enzyme
VGRKQGISDQQLYDLTSFADSPHFSGIEKACLQYSEEMTRTPVAVPDELFAELRRYFDAEQLVELTANVALENFRARFNHALDIPSDGLCELPPNHPVRIGLGK